MCIYMYIVHIKKIEISFSIKNCFFVMFVGCLVCDFLGHHNLGCRPRFDGRGHLCPLLCAQKHSEVGLNWLRGNEETHERVCKGRENIHNLSETSIKLTRCPILLKTWELLICEKPLNVKNAWTSMPQKDSIIKMNTTQ